MITSVCRSSLAVRAMRLGARILMAAGWLATVSAATVRFREPLPATYVLEEPAAAAPGASRATPAPRPWTRATAADDPEHQVEFSDRVVLQTGPGVSPEGLLATVPITLTLDRQPAPGLFILQAADSLAAIEAAAVLSEAPGVIACYPVMRRPLGRQSAFAPVPNDPYFNEQWHLDHRGTDRNLTGPDLNVRGAWPVTRGEGVIVGVGDDGVQTSHPDLSPRIAQGLSYNFFRSLPTGLPASSEANHGTAVAGLVSAEDNNGRGVSGVAPRAQLVSWVLFGTSVFGFESFASDEQLMDMFQYRSNQVAVQNHSWGNATLGQLGMDALASSGVGNAVTNGRGGLGVVIVRAAGNARLRASNANDDGFAADPRVVTVAAIRKDGRVTSYSSPGANILVGAPSGDTFPPEGDGLPTDDVLTTDRTGNDGYSAGSTDRANYTGFDGTSASSPQVAGVAAMVVAANTNLTFRDVQHILALSSRHLDFADPSMRTNGAGFRVSENVGFGMPDAAAAVQMALRWNNLLHPERVVVESRVRREIPDDALRVGLAGPDVPPTLRSVKCLPSLGRHPDNPTGFLPIVDVGLANGPITRDLTGRAALIQRGGTLFAEKIERAAQAGASFAVVYNNTGTTEIQAMGGTKFARIPAVSIARSTGDAIRTYAAANPTATARLLLIPTFYTLEVTNTLICTHVGVRLRTTHTRRSDVRVTLVSPMGTRSILQAINNHEAPGPVDWTYWSTQHFYESSFGEWRVEVSDERDTVIPLGAGTRPATGAVTLVQLIVDGIPITDTDRDGLDDEWERQAFGDLRFGPRDDPDGDGASNAREQMVGTPPHVSDAPLRLEWTEFEPGFWRFEWPALDGLRYSLRTASSVGGSFVQRAAVPGRFPFTEYVIRAPADLERYFGVSTNTP